MCSEWRIWKMSRAAAFCTDCRRLIKWAGRPTSTVTVVEPAENKCCDEWPKHRLWHWWSDATQLIESCEATRYNALYVSAHSEFRCKYGENLSSSFQDIVLTMLGYTYVCTDEWTQYLRPHYVGQRYQILSRAKKKQSPLKLEKVWRSSTAKMVCG